MAIDYAEKEREFLESLAADTGRDLAGWMSAIAATSLSDRNAIIDWLRQQGFLFARASWLERIYHNGGRPIYLDAGELGSPSKAAPAAVTSPQSPQPPPVTMNAAVVRPLPVAGVAAVPVTAPPFIAPTQATTDTLVSLLAEAKGYRPLAQLLVREIERVVPEITFEARTGYIALCIPDRTIGVLTLSAKELRLALDWPPDKLAPAGFSRAKFPKPSPDVPMAISQMMVLTDARQVTADLMAAVGAAARPR